MKFILFILSIIVFVFGLMLLPNIRIAGDMTVIALIMSISVNLFIGAAIADRIDALIRANKKEG